MKPIFKFLTGDVNALAYGAKYVSQKFNNSEFDFWFILELINMDDACGRDNDSQPKYIVELSVVSPDQAGPENLAKAFESCGIDRDELKDNDIVKVEALSSYGISAHLKSFSGNNAHKLLREAKREAQMSEFLFGFAMDRPVNRIGTTGWEAIKGDITAGLNRTIASGTVEGQILGKMHSA